MGRRLRAGLGAAAALAAALAACNALVGNQDGVVAPDGGKEGGGDDATSDSPSDSRAQADGGMDATADACASSCPPVTLVTNQPPFAAIALDDQYVYWTSTTSLSLMRVPKSAVAADGGVVVDTAPLGNQGGGPIVLHGTTLDWFSPGNELAQGVEEIRRVDLTTGDAGDNPIHQPLLHLTSDDALLYWTTSDAGVNSCAAGSCTPSNLDRTASAYDIALVPGAAPTLVWSDRKSMTVRACVAPCADAGSTVVFADAGVTPLLVAAPGRFFVYVADDAGAGGLYSAPPVPGNAAAFVGDVGPDVVAFAVDGDGNAFGVKGAETGYLFVLLGADAGGARPLVAATNPRAIAVDAQYVYWAEDGPAGQSLGTIKRLPLK